MGNCGGKDTGDPAVRKASKQINEELRRAKQELEDEVKLLLLGAGESGKSTIAKQMKIIYLNGFSEADRMEFRIVVHQNVIASAKALINAASKFNYRISKENRKAVKLIEESRGLDLTSSIADAVQAIWKDKAIKKTFARASEFQLLDSAAYYLNDLDRIKDEDYCPTVDDVLRSRAKTTGVTEIDFMVESTKFRMVDVGGQRSERRKWIHCFEDVTAVIFVVAISEYDQKLYEDESVNRMDEALKLFNHICNSEWFANTSIILFLNKDDIFREKIQHVDLNVCFPDYRDGKNEKKAREFIKTKFISMNENPTKKQVYPHVTCATDTKNIKFVFKSVKSILLQQAIGPGGI